MRDGTTKTGESAARRNRIRAVTAAGAIAGWTVGAWLGLSFGWQQGGGPGGPQSLHVAFCAGVGSLLAFPTGAVAWLMAVMAEWKGSASLPRDPIPTWYFAVVVVRRGDDFLLVHECKHSRLWY